MLQNEIRNPTSEIRNSLPIGIFDSGVGGLTVYRALHERLPNEHFVYLGDTARVPYGTKSLATVERYATENSRFLESHGIKLLVVACNTASALALPAIREAVGVDVVGVIDPGARAAIEIALGKTIGVIATEATVQSRAYARSISRIDPAARVIERACPLFVSLAEEGWADTDVARLVAEQRSLFARTPRLPEGLLYTLDFLGPDEERTLLEEIPRLPLQEARYKAFTAKRRIMSYGAGYDFDSNDLMTARGTTAVP